MTIPRFTMGESRLVCHRTTPFQVDRPEELYLDLQLKWFSECRAKVAFELHALTGGGVFTCYITNASFEGTLRIGTTFVDQRPWAGQLHLSFVETPKVDFDIEVLKGSVTSTVRPQKSREQSVARYDDLARQEVLTLRRVVGAQRSGI